MHCDDDFVFSHVVFMCLNSCFPVHQSISVDLERDRLRQVKLCPRLTMR